MEGITGSFWIITIFTLLIYGIFQLSDAQELSLTKEMGIVPRLRMQK